MSKPDRVIRIRDFIAADAAAFERINVEWIAAMFTLEANDRLILSDPQGAILDRGGVILIAETSDLGVIGTCALMAVAPGVYELTKMAVSASARGRGAGVLLLDAALARAEAMSVTDLYLLTNRRCATAIRLYERAGFVHDSEVMRDHAGRYGRCDVAMRYRGRPGRPPPA